MAMRRREFITMLSGAAACPLSARAQQLSIPVVGFVRSSPASGFTHLVNLFRQGLEAAGFINGQNVVIEIHWTDRIDRLPELLEDLLRRKVAVIVGNSLTARAALAATKSTPIVFIVGSDPVRTGLVSSINRPGGNATGVVFNTTQLAAKRLALLHELVPNAGLVAVLLDPTVPDTAIESKDAEEAGRTLMRKLLILNASNAQQIDNAFDTIVRSGAGALLVGSGPLFLGHRSQLAMLAERNRLPTSYVTRQYPAAGGLMSYGPSQTDAYLRAGAYVGRILKGVKPADIPVELPTKFELVINIKSAKALGLEIPPTLLARADEVIE
jgi:putative ABC transport system substrate-binding protein